VDFDPVSIAKPRGCYENCLGVASSLALILGASRLSSRGG